mmetsp:Transcript_28474/g.67788  ORF Transcript_28474/g.67788 Transcript_28474/m.67788 type:complete len:528 (-) Transcript_28474:206-1789(-)
MADPPLDGSPVSAEAGSLLRNSSGSGPGSSPAPGSSPGAGCRLGAAVLIAEVYVKPPPMLNPRAVAAVLRREVPRGADSNRRPDTLRVVVQDESQTPQVEHEVPDGRQLRAEVREVQDLQVGPRPHGPQDRLRPLPQIRDRGIGKETGETLQDGAERCRQHSGGRRAVKRVVRSVLRALCRLRRWRVRKVAERLLDVGLCRPAGLQDRPGALEEPHHQVPGDIVGRDDVVHRTPGRGHWPAVGRGRVPTLRLGLGPVDERIQEVGEVRIQRVAPPLDTRSEHDGAVVPAVGSDMRRQQHERAASGRRPPRMLPPRLGGGRSQGAAGRLLPGGRLRLRLLAPGGRRLLGLQRRRMSGAGRLRAELCLHRAQDLGDQLVHVRELAAGPEVQGELHRANCQLVLNGDRRRCRTLRGPGRRVACSGRRPERPQYLLEHLVQPRGPRPCCLRWPRRLVCPSAARSNWISCLRRRGIRWALHEVQRVAVLDTCGSKGGLVDKHPASVYDPLALRRYPGKAFKLFLELKHCDLF